MQKFQIISIVINEVPLWKINLTVSSWIYFMFVFVKQYMWGWGAFSFFLLDFIEKDWLPQKKQTVTVQPSVSLSVLSATSSQEPG